MLCRLLVRKGEHTANSAAVECTELSTPNAVQLSGTPDNGWYLISPYGEFPAPHEEGEDPTHVQIFGADQAREVVATFNSLSGRAARLFKNMWHGLGNTTSVPIFEGHSDCDPKRWATMNRLAEIMDLRADTDGLWGQVTWNATALQRRTQELGALKPSPLFWHEPRDAKKQVYPAMLESVGLVRFPNIRTAPTWTQNSAFSGPSPEENKNQNMNAEQLKALARALNLPETTDPAKLIETAQSAYQLSTANAAKVQEKETALQTATSAKSELETKLTTANSLVTNITSERDSLKTANSALTTEAADLRKGLLDLAEKKGAITPAERKDYETKLTTANARGAALAELPGRKAMNTEQVVLNGNRVDLTTANSRRAVLTTAIEQRMASDKCDYDTAYGRVSQDPNFAALFAAMQDPTKKSA